MRPDGTRTYARPAGYDLVASTVLWRTGSSDPTLRREPSGLVRATRMTSGPATVRLALKGGEISAEAWGEGADDALNSVPTWLGLEEPRWELGGHPLIEKLARQHAGLRLTNRGNVYEALIQTVLGQLVTWREAALIRRLLCERLGEPAPGPLGLHLPPGPKAIRAVGLGGVSDVGIGLQRAQTIVEIARVAHALQRAASLPTPEAIALLTKVRGVGPWTAAVVMGQHLGRPEPVPLGDYHLPNLVAWALAGEPRADDARMLELLAPFAGQATRVILLLWASGIEAPKYGPKRPFVRRRF